MDGVFSKEWAKAHSWRVASGCDRAAVHQELAPIGVDALDEVLIPQHRIALDHVDNFLVGTGRDAFRLNHLADVALRARRADFGPSETFIFHFRDGKVSEFWYSPLDQVAFDAWIGR